MIKSQENINRLFQKNQSESKKQQKQLEKPEKPKDDDVDETELANQYYETGLKIYNGKKCKVDHPLAFKYFQKAANRNQCFSMQTCYSMVMVSQLIKLVLLNISNWLLNEGIKKQ